MFQRIQNRFKFQIERWVLWGAPVSPASDRYADRIGVSVWRPGRSLGTESFSQEGQAIWWAFRRLTDPGNLGDDEGLFTRVLSSVLTVLGYVLFMGSLIAIMTQWLNAKLRHWRAD